MKTKEELNALKEEVEAPNKELEELSEEELEQVNGGTDGAKKFFPGEKDFGFISPDGGRSCGKASGEAWATVGEA